jgi:hypothetical protein
MPDAAASATVSATSAGDVPKQCSRSALTGSSVAAASAAAWPIASSRVTPPSGRPSELAKPALVVASAGKPRCASSLALPGSQALAITSGAVAW